jgi:hypothetical protein
MWHAYAPLAGDVDPQDVERRVLAARERIRREARAALGRLTFPVYAVRGREARIGGWGSSDRELTSVTVEHGPPDRAAGPLLSVHSEREAHAYEGELARARSTLRGALWAHSAGWPDRSEAGRAIWMHARELEHRRAAALAASARRTLLVDGEPVEFATVATASRWVAVARRGELTITVSAHGADLAGVELVTVSDPLGSLVAPD